MPLPHAEFFASTPQVVRVGEVDLATYETGTGPAVIMLHGFPELAYSWRNQFPAIARAGFRAIAYDQRGYGRSSRPERVEDYSLEHLVADVVGLMDVLGLESSVVVGHDWGSIVAWSAALLEPQRVRAVASLNVPYRGWCCGFPTTEYIRAHLTDRFEYVLAFQEPGVTEAQFMHDPDGWLRAMLRRGGGDLSFLTEEVLGVYRDALVAGGLTGPLNFYRNIDHNAATTAHLAGAPVTQPSLMLAADNDPILPASLTDGMERWIDDLDVRIIDDCGHWSQQEQPAAVNRRLVAFLDGLTREEDRWT